MSSPTISQIRGQIQPDFQKTYQWWLSFTRLPSFSGWSAAIQQSDPSYWFNMLCVSTDVPKRTGSPATFFLHGNQIFDPGIYNVSGTLALTFVEQVTSPVRTLISQWEQACANKKGTFWELTADLRLVTYDNQQNESWEYQIFWCFHQDSNINALSGESGDPMQPSLTVQYTTFGEGPAGQISLPD
jgi:hypothetical protein